MNQYPYNQGGYPPPQLSSQDRQALDMADWTPIFFLFCCQCVGLIYGIYLYAGCQTPEGKAKAGRLITFSAIGMVIGTVIRLLAGTGRH